MVGPGLGTDESAKTALMFVPQQRPSGHRRRRRLTILSAHPHLVAKRDAPTVLTPHAGEYERLAGGPGEDRLGAARRLAESFGATVLLKGNVTVIADPADHLYLNPAGASWAATAGSGRPVRHHRRAARRGPAPGEAAAMAAFVHARAANDSAADPGRPRSRHPPHASSPTSAPPSRGFRPLLNQQ